MTLCPIALAVHCVRCPIVRVCPAKNVIGDYAKHPPEEKDPRLKADPTLRMGKKD